MIKRPPDQSNRSVKKSNKISSSLYPCVVAAAAATMVVVRGGAVDKDAAALAEELPAGAGTSLNGFFDHTGLEAAGGGGQREGEEEEEEEELEWLSNKDAFPSVETMAAEAEVEVAPARAAVKPRTKGLRRRRRVTAPWSLPPVLPSPRQAADGAPRRRCTHCAVEETPQWRFGPDGPRTLCNACGVRFKTGRLFPEYRPANSPTFSPLLHSNSHRRVLEMRRQSGEETSAAGRVGARARRADRAAARAAAKDK